MDIKLNEDLREEFKKEFPVLFQSNEREIIIGPGWIPLVKELCRKLEDINELRKEDEGYVHCLQVKEKFGGLRFYVAYDMTFIKNLIDEINFLTKQAEEKSLTVCEVSGNPGELYKKVKWLKTLCAEEAEKLGFNKKS